MSIIDLPNEILITIIEFVNPHDEYIDISDDFNELFVVKILILICKRFNFLLDYSYLINTTRHYEIYHTFMTVNYRGYYNGVQYHRYCNKWSGYIDDKLSIFYCDHKFIPHINKINIDDYDYALIDSELYDYVCQKLYKNFRDSEIKNFIEKHELHKKEKTMLIRKKFPKLEFNSQKIQKIIKLLDQDPFNTRMINQKITCSTESYVWDNEN